MLVVDNIIILHLYKCAGSSIRWGLINANYTYRYSCEHAPIKTLPNKYKTLPKLAFIRNPISWYTSLYFSSINRKMKRMPLLKCLSEGYTFHEFVKNATNLRKFFSDNTNLEKYKKYMVSSIMNTYCCWLINEWEDISIIKYTDFNETLLDYYYCLLGLNTAKVFKLENGIEQLIPYFPNMKILYRNKTKNIPIDIDTRIKKIIFTEDIKYFKKFNYSII